MISSLDDAWKWYTSVKELTLTMLALGKKHWNALPWNGQLGQDDRLAVGHGQLQDRVTRLLQHRLPHREQTLVGIVQDVARDQERCLDVLEAKEPSARRSSLDLAQRRHDGRSTDWHRWRRLSKQALYV